MTSAQVVETSAINNSSLVHNFPNPDELQTTDTRGFTSFSIMCNKYAVPRLANCPVD